jgi:glycerol-3-phosphate cytidylyltransferase
MKRIITYGTFDLFHRGHQSILERAKALGGYLVVGVTGERYDMERGKLNVHDSLPERIENVRATGLADEIIVEEYLGQKISDIVKYHIDALAIGSDWKGKLDYLKQYCEVVYLERTKDISSTQLRADATPICRLGLITDSGNDGGLIAESRFVSGLEAVGACVLDAQSADQSAFAPDRASCSGAKGNAGSCAQHDFASGASQLKHFTERWDIGMVCTEPDELIETSDIVYIHTARSKREAMVRKALSGGCHVITDFPAADIDGMDALWALAADKGLNLSGRFSLPCLKTFQQLLWLVHGGAIGKILNIRCATPPLSGGEETVSAFLACMKLLGTKAQGGIWKQAADVAYSRIQLEYDNAGMIAEISALPWIDAGMWILGTLGRIDIPGTWWRMSHFKITSLGQDAPKYYSFDTEGTGLRYLLGELLVAVREGRIESVGLNRADTRDLLELTEGFDCFG